MDSTPLYLRPDVQIEPLIDQWYAWSYLVPPATAARNITDRHLPIMNSYVMAPEVHAVAAKDPKMLGGPFIDYGGKRVDEIRGLCDRVRSERSHLVELSTALTQLDGMLRAHAKGFSLESLYPKTPQPLRGYVELVYDLNNQPSYRLLEPLLYRSRYYDTSLQSLMLSITRGDDRPFVLSTPRLEDDHILHWRTTFADEAVDRLFRLKSTPACYRKIRDLMGGAGGQDTLLESFFTSTAPRPYQRYTGDTARWRYFGHACVLVETPHTSILFDPVLSYTYESNISRYTYQDLPDRIDFVVITHNHQDHVLFETMLQIRHKVGCIIVPRSHSTLQDPSLRLLLQQVGFANVVELGELDEIPIENGAITAVPFLGEHADLDVRTKAAYLVRIGRHSLLFAADSCNVEPRLYEHLHAEIGDVDAVFLGMECVGAPLSWLYGPLLSRRMDRAMDESRRLSGSNYEQAADLVRRFNCREVYVYAMGQEPWLNHVMSLKYTEQSKPIVDSNRLIHECREKYIVAERLFGEKEMFLAAS